MKNKKTKRIKNIRKQILVKRAQIRDKKKREHIEHLQIVQEATEGKKRQPIININKKMLPKRNEPCFCKSGKKFKYCCWLETQRKISTGKVNAMIDVE